MNDQANSKKNTIDKPKAHSGYIAEEAEKAIHEEEVGRAAPENSCSLQLQRFHSS